MSTTTALREARRTSILPELPSELVRRSPLLCESCVLLSELTPEHRLMIAVLRDAIQSIRKHRDASDPCEKALFAIDAEWMLSDEVDRVHSFVRICQALKLHPDAVRRAVGLVPETPVPEAHRFPMKAERHRLHAAA